MTKEKKTWWKEGVVYQIYPRSFQDSNGDGIGDLRGITSRLGYVKSLGADVIWLNPCYKSPNDDNGYDIADYRAIMDDFGTMEDFDELLATAHKLGIRIVMDLVVNHSSDEHPWFVESRKSRDNDKADFYIWADKPNNWGSCFGGPAWEYCPGRDQWYLHCFSKKQPDLNWENPRVREEVYSLMRFWGDKGIDGFRMDVINMISKVPGYPDGPLNGKYGDYTEFVNNGPRVHEFLQEMNREAISRYDWLTVGEAPSSSVEHALLYTGFDRSELNMTFQFEHMDLGKSTAVDLFKRHPFSLPEWKRIFDKWQTGLEGRGWNSLYLENHDQSRCVSRYGDTSTKESWKRSAKAIALVYFMMKGTPYIYEGQEIGMMNMPWKDKSEFRDISAIRDLRELAEAGVGDDEAVRLTGEFTRDNNRTPMQWENSPKAGFTTGAPWIGINTESLAWANVKDQEDDPDSILNFYRAMIKTRIESETLLYGVFTLLCPDDERVFAYTRTLGDEEWLVTANLSKDEVESPVALDGEIVLSNTDNTSATLLPWECRLIRRNK